MSNYVNYEMLIYDNWDGNTWRTTNAIETVEWSTYLEDDPGRLTFYIHKVDSIAFWEGATIVFKVDSQLVFRGIVFKKERTQEVDLIKVTAYDYKIYLKYKDSFVFEQKTLPQIFESVCDKFDLDFEVIDDTSYQVVDRVFDTKTGMDVIQTSIDDVLINTGSYYVVRSVDTKLQLVNAASLQSNILLGDGSAIISFNYTTTIEDSYNQIKLYRDNQDSGKREIYIVQDSTNIDRWGLLQYYSEVSDTLNEAQVGERAEAILGLYNKTYRGFKCTECLGDLSIFAGARAKLRIRDLGDISLDDNLLIDQCTHTFNDGLHTMSFTAEIKRNF